MTAMYLFILPAKLQIILNSQFSILNYFRTFARKIREAMKIFAVGMNYIQHNKELDGALYKPEKPVIFTS